MLEIGEGSRNRLRHPNQDTRLYEHNDRVQDDAGEIGNPPPSERSTAAVTNQGKVNEPL